MALPYAPPAILRETLAVQADTGVRVLDLEVVRINDRFAIDDVLPLLEVGAQLKASHLLVAGDDPDLGRMTDSFARLCERASEFGLTADLEFMPWTEVPDLRTAATIVCAADQANAGVLVDALHLSRSGGTFEQVAALPRSWLHYAQLARQRVLALL